MEKVFDNITNRGLKVGIRVIPHGEEVEIGEAHRNSFGHDYENDISSYHSDDPMELDGACAIEVDYDWEDEDFQLFLSEVQYSLEFAKSLYQGQQIVLIGGDNYSWGDDDKEVIIEGAEVLHIFE